jgi:hypothetical protein
MAMRRSRRVMVDAQPADLSMRSNQPLVLKLQIYAAAIRHFDCRSRQRVERTPQPHI